MAPRPDKLPSRYARLLEAVFLEAYRPGDLRVLLLAARFEVHAGRLGIRVKTISSLIYYFRHGRADLPTAMQQVAPPRREWMIEVAASGYVAVAVTPLILPEAGSVDLVELPDWTRPEAMTTPLRDEQWIITRLHRNHALAHFLGGRLTLLQCHMRTSNGLGQVEVDALLYAQVRGETDAVVPVQAKAGTRRSTLQAQVRQDIAFCRRSFPDQTPRPLGIEQLDRDEYLVCEFALRAKTLRVVDAQRYRLRATGKRTLDEPSQTERRPSG